MSNVRIIYNDKKLKIFIFLNVISILQNKKLKFSLPKLNEKLFSSIELC